MSEYAGLQIIRDMAQAEWHRLQAAYSQISIGRKAMDQGVVPYGATREYKELIRANIEADAIVTLNTIGAIGSAIKRLDTLIKQVGEEEAK